MCCRGNYGGDAEAAQDKRSLRGQRLAGSCDQLQCLHSRGRRLQKVFRNFLSILLVVISLIAISQAQSDNTQRLARTLLEEMVNIKSTESGVGSTPVVQVLEKHFRDAGYGGADLFIGGKEPHKQNIVIRLHGTGPGKGVLLLAHLDVVEANKEDWSPELDPFKFMEKDGYFYGRGTQDVKEGAALLAANMIRWKQAGWKPSRDVILALTADEESGGANGVSWLLTEPSRVGGRRILSEHGWRRFRRA